MSDSKTLLLVRHAKSSWKQPNLEDVDRPLNQRGTSDAPEMGRRLRSRSLVPDLIVSSPAVRARKTAEAIAEEVGYVDDVVINDDLYHADPDDVLNIVSGFDDQVRTAMVVGHNPTMTELANMWSSTPIDNVPTCGVLSIELTTWSAVETARLLDFDYPKKR